MLIKSYSRRFRMATRIVVCLQIGFIVAKTLGILTLPWLWAFAPVIFTGIIIGAYLVIAAFIILITGG